MPEDNPERLTRLFSVVAPAEPVVQVVFIHGLNEEWNLSWGFDRPVSWRDYLELHVPDAAVWSLDYEVTWTKRSGGGMPLVDRAINVLATIDDELDHTRPLVLIGHSYGGLLIKEMVRVANEGQYEWVGQKLCAAVFVAVPHNGSTIPKYVDALRRILQPGPAIAELMDNAPALRALDSSFRYIYEKRREAGDPILVEAFTETKDTMGVRVVDEGSSNPHLTKVHPVPITGDHNTIMRAPYPPDVRVGRVVGLVAKVAKVARGGLADPRLPNIKALLKDRYYATAHSSVPIRSNERPSQGRHANVVRALALLGTLAVLVLAGVLLTQRTPAPPLLSKVQDCPDVCPVLVYLPGGEFEMGSKEGIDWPDDTSQPAHTVRIEEGLYFGETEVTAVEWDACVRAGVCSREAGGDYDRNSRAPLEFINFDDTQDYVRWLSETTGKVYRLPTEAEWEFAARGGATTTYPWGEDMALANAAVCWGCPGAFDGSVSKTSAPVGRYGPNAFGLFDMAGNVSELVGDCWVSGYADAPVDGSARVLQGCPYRIIRGGSYLDPPLSLRVFARYPYRAADRSQSVGFRVVRDPA